MTSDEFARWVEALRPVLYRVCRVQLSIPADREDAVQEAVFRAWRKRNSLRDARRFDTWMIRILVNECRDIQRRHRYFVVTDALPEIPAAGGNGGRELRDALLQLDEKQRLCMLLHYIEGYKVKEVARMLGLGESAVKARLMRGRQRLKEMLSEEAFEE